MKTQNKIVAIVPAYNEARTIEGVIDDLHTYGVIPLIIDDGSSDDTRKRALNKGARVVSHLLNRGQGAALQTGMMYAKQFSPDCILHFDSDGQHQARDIEKFTKAILSHEFDVVLGSRFLQKNDIPFFKTVLLKVALIYTRLTTGLVLTDTHNGFRAFSPYAASKLQIRQSGMAHASEILEQISTENLSFKEVPVTILYSPYTIKKGQKLSNSFKILLDLWLK